MAALHGVHPSVRPTVWLDVWMSGFPLALFSDFKRLLACGDLPLFRLSSWRPGGGERWCREAISHIQFTYGCHGLLQAERWCHPVRGAPLWPPGGWEDFSLSVGGEKASPWWEHYHCSSMMNVGRHFSEHVCTYVILYVVKCGHVLALVYWMTAASSFWPK